MSSDIVDYGYHQPTPNSQTYVAAAMMKLIPRSPRLRILELGCGNGSFAAELAELGHDVTGVEPSQSGIEIARRHFPKVRFVHAAMGDLDKHDVGGEFDLVVSKEVIEHLLYPGELVDVARKSLRAGGRILLSTPYHGYVKNLALAASGKLDSHFTALWDGGHIKFFSVATLTKLVRERGFTDVEFTFAGRLPLLWKSMVCRARLAS